jgi:hypothetical protein
VRSRRFAQALAGSTGFRRRRTAFAVAFAGVFAVALTRTVGDAPIGAAAAASGRPVALIGVPA